MSKKKNKSTDNDHQIVQNIEVKDEYNPDSSFQSAGDDPTSPPLDDNLNVPEETLADEEASAVEVIELASSPSEHMPEDPQADQGLVPEETPDQATEVEVLNSEDATEEPLESSEDEMEDPEASIIDSELMQLLRTPLGLRGAVEALLFSAPEPLTARRIAKAIGMSDLRLVTATLQQLQTDYDNQRRGLQIIENTQGFQMATRELFGDLILNLRGRKRRPSLSQAALETMAIIAYRQPIIRAEVEAVRGVESSGTIRNLIDMGLVEMVGRKDVIGRPPMYGTTETFLNTFGLKQIDDLPSIGELKRHADESDKEKEAAEIETARAEREKAEKEASQAAEDARAAREQAAREQQIEIEREKAAIAAIDDDDEADNWDDESPDETLEKPEADEAVIKNETELEDGAASDEDDSLEDALGLEDEMDDENEDVFDDDPDDIGEIDDASIVDDINVSESADDDLDLEDDLIQGEDDDEDDFDDEDFDEDEDEDDFDEDENEDEERPVDSETGDEPGDESRP